MRVVFLLKKHVSIFYSDHTLFKLLKKSILNTQTTISFFRYSTIIMENQILSGSIENFGEMFDISTAADSQETKQIYTNGSFNDFSFNLPEGNFHIYVKE